MRNQDRLLIRALQGAAAVVLVLAVVAALVPGGIGRWAGWLMVGVLIGAPVARVARLVWTWWRAGDRRHALRGLALLLALLVGALAAFLGAALAA
jgi:hypothetical protein